MVGCVGTKVCLSGVHDLDNRLVVSSNLELYEVLQVVPYARTSIWDRPGGLSSTVLLDASNIIKSQMRENINQTLTNFNLTKQTLKNITGKRSKVRIRVRDIAGKRSKVRIMVKKLPMVQLHLLCQSQIVVVVVVELKK